MRHVGGVIHIGFGVMLLFAVIVLLVIGIVNPDLFKQIVELLRELSRAIFPGIVQSLV